MLNLYVDDEIDTCKENVTPKVAPMSYPNSKPPKAGNTNLKILAPKVARENKWGWICKDSGLYGKESFPCLSP